MMQSSALKNDKRKLKRIPNSRESIFEPTFMEFPESKAGTSSAGSTTTLQRKCKQFARKFIKSLAYSSGNKSNSGKNQEKLKKDDVLGKKGHHFEPIRVTTAKNQSKGMTSTLNPILLKEQESRSRWQTMMKDIDKSIANASIRDVYYGNVGEDNMKEQTHQFVRCNSAIDEKSMIDLPSAVTDSVNSPKSNMLTRSMSMVNLRNNGKNYNGAVKKNNNLVDTTNLKKELDTLHFDRPVNKITNTRSKSVTFIDKVGTTEDQEKNIQKCPNCHKCYQKEESVTDENYYEINDSPYYCNITTFLRRPTHFGNQGQNVTISNLNLTEKKRNMIISCPDGNDLQMRSYQSVDDNLNKIDKFEIELNPIPWESVNRDIKSFDSHSRNLRSNDANLYQNTINIFSNVNSEMAKTLNNTGNLDKTESIIYRNPFYLPFPFVPNNNVNNYDVKMYESKLTMNFLLDTQNQRNKACPLRRSQSLRVNMDLAEAITCENHDYEQLVLKA